jgi:hypothetical protein
MYQRAKNETEHCKKRDSPIDFVQSRLRFGNARKRHFALLARLLALAPRRVYPAKAGRAQQSAAVAPFLK